MRLSGKLLVRLQNNEKVYAKNSVYSRYHCFLVVVYQALIVNCKNTFVCNQTKAVKYSLLARKLPAGDIRALRLRAMAKALRSGATEYQFETGPIGPMGQK